MKHLLHPSEDPGPSEHGGKRQDVALCLSGGGFRAALFHLGALRRLNELGILEDVDTISLVSGGSIFAAHLAKVAKEKNVWPIWPEDWESTVSKPFFDFVSKDLRTLLILSKYLPWNLVRPGLRVKWLQDGYARKLTKGLSSLSELPTRPRYIFCATDLDFGDVWVFERDKVGGPRRGYVDPASSSVWTVAMAVAASSCFPPVFGPMKIPWNHDDYVSLSDGGVRDNMGVEPVWHDHECVIASDGGAPLYFSSEVRLFPGLRRVFGVSQHQSFAVRKRWLIAEFRHKAIRGTYWSLGSATDGYKNSDSESEIAPAGYTRQLAENVISNIRTDLNRFSADECKVLENHGYLLANAAAQRWLEHLKLSQNAKTALSLLSVDLT